MPSRDKPTDESPGRLVSFYAGESTDDSGRSLDEILSWSDDRLEDVHDYIQWLFPLKERSRFNPAAPILSDELISSFRSDARLREKLIKSFKRMLAFYGFDSEEKGGAFTLSRSGEYGERKSVWVNHGNHNYLRITRILTSLRLLGLEQCALAFFDALTEVYQEEKREIGVTAFNYWRQAAGLN
jgi:hypothetical protein